MANILSVKKCECGGTYELAKNEAGDDIVMCNECGLIMSIGFYERFVSFMRGL